MKYGIRLKAYKKSLLYCNKYISSKIKIYNDTILTEFKYKKILEDNKHCQYIAI